MVYLDRAGSGGELTPNEVELVRFAADHSDQLKELADRSPPQVHRVEPALDKGLVRTDDEESSRLPMSSATRGPYAFCS